MTLIPDLLKIISEYADPETYMLLKSINYPVIAFHKYEDLITQQIRESEELKNHIIEYKQYIAELGKWQTIDVSQFGTLEEHPLIKWSGKLGDLQPIIDSLLTGKLNLLLENMKTFEFITYSYQNNDLIINNLRFGTQVVTRFHRNIEYLMGLENLSPCWGLLCKLLNILQGLHTYNPQRMESL